jgi:hypothetical protein
VTKDARFQKAGGESINKRVHYIVFPWSERLHRYAPGLARTKNGKPVNNGGYWSYKDACNLVESGHWEKMPDSEDVPSIGMDEVW